MKRGLKVLFGMSLLIAFAVPAFSQPSSRSVETFVMESFDSVGEQNYMYDGNQLSWEWGVQSSRFVAEGYPKQNYFEGIPNSLKELLKGDDKAHMVLGVQAAFNRKGDNWFEVYPTKDDAPFEIPFVGTVTQLDFWVWGANYLYFLEVMVRDANGRVHVLPAGNLKFNGWQNKVVNVPTWLVQHSQLRSGPTDMTFVGFRIRSDADEFVDNFVIFFDQLKYTTNSLSLIYDGYELKNADFGDSDSSEVEE